MFAKIRRRSVPRSFTADSSLFRRFTRRSRSAGTKTPHKESTTSTIDSSSDEADHRNNHNITPRYQTIRWARTDSIKKDNNNNNDATTQEEQPLTEQQRRHKKMKELPSTGAFSSNLILVNRERIHRGKEPLVRCRHLDGIAKKHAIEMAAAQKLLERPICSFTMAENVQRGPSIRVIHQMIMVGVSDAERNNILSDKFSRFGMGTATGEDGMIYMSQVFQSSAAKRRPTC